MLDPNYLAHVADDLEEQFAELETDILKDIARRIRQNDYSNTATAAHQLNQLHAFGAQTEWINAELAKILGKTQKEVDKIISNSVSSSIAIDKSMLEEAVDVGLIERAVKESSLKKEIKKGIKALNVEISNICNSTVITAKKELTAAMNKAYLQISSGAFSEDIAIHNVVKDLSQQGLGMIEYRSGVHRQLDTAIRTAVRTSVNQTTLACQETLMDDWDVNLVEVSSHGGARPEHAAWQGKVFWRNKRVKGYDNFYSATGYGTGAGLGGWNCRHSFYPYFEGLSYKSFKPIDLEENERLYMLEQEQRYNERKIREWKRRRDVCKAGGIDSTRESAKVREWNARQKEFLKKHPELKQNYARQKVYLSSEDGIINLSDIRISGALDPNSKKANKHAEQYYESVRKMRTDYKKIAENTGFDENEIKRIKNYLFIDEHKLLTGIKRFDSDYKIGESWRRLIEGKSIQQHDLTLLKHERYEHELIKDGLDQDSAHIMASKKYNYKKEAEEYYAKINQRKKK